MTDNQPVVVVYTRSENKLLLLYRNEGPKRGLRIASGGKAVRGGVRRFLVEWTKY